MILGIESNTEDKRSLSQVTRYDLFCPYLSVGFGVPVIWVPIAIVVLFGHTARNRRIVLVLRIMELIILFKVATLLIFKIILQVLIRRSQFSFELTCRVLSEAITMYFVGFLRPTFQVQIEEIVSIAGFTVF